MKQPQDWTEQARALLETSARDLDAATLSRLNQARQRALAPVSKRTPVWMWSRRLAAAASLLLAVAMLWPEDPAGVAPSTSPALSPDDAELLADSDLEMTDELEFYAWLDADDEHNG